MKNELNDINKGLGFGKTLYPVSTSFPIVTAEDIKGGLHSVESKSDLGSISDKHLEEGMLAYVSEDDAYYKYTKDNEGSLVWTKLDIQPDDYKLIASTYIINTSKAPSDPDEVAVTITAMNGNSIYKEANFSWTTINSVSGVLQIKYSQINEGINKISVNWKTPKEVKLSVDVQLIKDGTNGTSGNYYTQTIYRSNETSSVPAIDRTISGIPTNWTLEGEGLSGYVFMSTSTVNADNGERIKISGTNNYWTYPIRITGLTGNTGDTGADGSDINFIYFQSNELITNTFKPTGITPEDIEESQEHQITDTSNRTWFDNPQGVTKDCQYEYVSVATKPSGKNTNWSDWSPAVVWSKYGQNGRDGDGIEYIYRVFSSEQQDTESLESQINLNASNPEFQVDDYLPDGWSDNPQPLSETNRYQYVAIRKKKDNVWGSFSEPTLWSVYSLDSNFDEIKEFYQTTKSETNSVEVTIDNCLDLGWSQEITQVTKEFPYLWNYEVTMGKSGSSGQSTVIGVTQPALIARWTEDGRSIGFIKEFYCATPNLAETGLPNIPSSGKYDSYSIDGASTSSTGAEFNNTKPFLYNVEVIFDTNKDYITNTGWQLISHYGVDGNAKGVDFEYSNDKVNWHKDYNPGNHQDGTTSGPDLYMRTVSYDEDNNKIPGSSMKIIGEDGQDGEYTDYSFNISINNTSSSVNTAPSECKYTEWSDGPVEPHDDFQYQWMRIIKYKRNSNGVVKPSDNPYYICLTGPEGQRGDDGAGREFIFLLTNDEKENIYDNDGYKQNDPNFESDSEAFQADDYVPIGSGWSDDIKEVTELTKYLYITSRTKNSSNGWSKFKEPQLFNKYVPTPFHVNLDNDSVILDDNIDNTATQNVSKCKFEIYEGNSLIDTSNYTITAEFSVQNGGQFTVEWSSDGNSWQSYSGQLSLSSNTIYTRLKKKSTNDLDEGGYGIQATFKITNKNNLGETTTITKVQSVLVKDISDGISYSIIAQPNILYLNNKGNLSPTSQPIQLKTQSYSGKNIVDVSSKITYKYQPIQENGQLGAETQITSNPWTLTTTTPAKGGYQINAYLNDKLVDSETISYAKQGDDGASPNLLDLTNEMDSVPVDSEGKVLFNVELQTEIRYYLGQTLLTNYEVIVPSNDETGFSIRENNHVVTITISKDYALGNRKVLEFSVGEHKAEFTIIGIETTTMYQLKPSASVIKKNSSGTLTPSKISCSVIKTTSQSSTELSHSQLPDNMAIMYSTNGSSTTTSYTKEISITTSTNSIEFYLLKDDVTIDKETIPVISDGQSGAAGEPGKNVIKLDLTNEMDSVALTTGGLTASQTVLKTTANLYDGTSLATGYILDVSIVDGSGNAISGVSYKIEGREAQITVNKGITFSKALVTISTTYNSNTYSAVFTIQGVKAGNSAVIYQIQPDASAIKINKTGTITPSSIGFSVNKINGTSVSSNADGDVKKYFKIGTKDETEYNGTIDLTDDVIDNQTESITFIIKNSKSTILDKETIPIIRDGENGVAKYYKLIVTPDRHYYSSNIDPGEPLDDLKSEIRAQFISDTGISEDLNISGLCVNKTFNVDDYVIYSLQNSSICKAEADVDSDGKIITVNNGFKANQQITVRLSKVLESFEGEANSSDHPAYINSKLEDGSISSPLAFGYLSTEPSEAQSPVVYEVTGLPDVIIRRVDGNYLPGNSVKVQLYKIIGSSRTQVQRFSVSYRFDDDDVETKDRTNTADENNECSIPFNGSSTWKTITIKFTVDDNVVLTKIINVVEEYQGIQGAVIRLSDWQKVMGLSDQYIKDLSDGEEREISLNKSSIRFCNNCIDDTLQDDETYYIDIVKFGDNYYKCIENHEWDDGDDINKGNFPSNAKNLWEEADITPFSYIDTLVTNYISTTTLSAKDVIILNDDNEIVAGMTSSEDNITSNGYNNLDDVRIWAGKAVDKNIKRAPFQVLEDGTVNIGEPADELNFNGTNIPNQLNPDGSGHLAYGNIKWTPKNEGIYLGGKLFTKDYFEKLYNFNPQGLFKSTSGNKHDHGRTTVFAGVIGLGDRNNSWGGYFEGSEGSLKCSGAVEIETWDATNTRPALTISWAEGTIPGENKLLQCNGIINTESKFTISDIDIANIYSDIRLKENITILNDWDNSPIREIEYNFKDKDDGRKHFGYIAQDVEGVYPDLVQTDSKGIKRLNIVELLVKEIADLKNEIRELKKQINHE